MKGYHVTVFVLCTSLFLLSGCKKSDPITECVKYYDINGQAIGTSGDCTNDNDWEFIALSSQEKSYLNFVDNISLTGTQTMNITGLQAFPIPVELNATMNMTLITTDTNKSVKVKLSIVDTNGNIVDEIALLRVAQVPWQINLPDSRYTAGEYYRIYYQVSAEGNPNFFEGYGDFIICEPGNALCQ